MYRLACLLAVMTSALVPALPSAIGQDLDKNKVSPLIAAMKFVKVPKGTFWMGGISWSAKAPRQVEIKEDFELAAYTVTQEQWEAVMGNNPSSFARQGKSKDKVKDVSEADLKRFPVESVSWHDAQEFLQKFNEREKGKQWLYRLPSWAEWEYACRNASTSKEDCSLDYYFSKPTNDLSSKQANFNGNRPGGKALKGPFLGRPTKVGQYQPNKLGLFDMHGNVYQWCQDTTAPGAQQRMMLGSGWANEGPRCAAGDYAWNDPTARSELTGFRIARVPSGGK